MPLSQELIEWRKSAEAQARAELTPRLDAALTPLSALLAEAGTAPNAQIIKLSPESILRGSMSFNDLNTALRETFLQTLVRRFTRQRLGELLDAINEE